jgi:hypothetical protein
VAARTVAGPAARLLLVEKLAVGPPLLYGRLRICKKLFVFVVVATIVWFQVLLGHRRDNARPKWTIAVGAMASFLDFGGAILFLRVS